MKKKRLIAFAVVLIFVGSSYALGWSTLFTVSSVKIQGTYLRLPNFVNVGEKLARVEPRVVAGKYEGIDFVEKARVSRNWVTGEVTVQITPRTPVAKFNGQVIDVSGKVITTQLATPKPLPIIQAVTAKEAAAGAKFISKLPEELKLALLSMKISPSGSYELDIKHGKRLIQIRWGAPTENTLKVAVYKALLERPENSKVVRIDLSAPHAPIVE
jgi:cell division septal protein FtsQ